ncbi:MAG: hypothetical protein ACFFC7_30175 [Candidatus Hermodarchaeota archaeon]
MERSFLLLGVLIVAFFLPTIYFFNINPVPVLSRHPVGAYFFHLNASNPLEQIPLEKFTQEAFIGHYNVILGCSLYIRTVNNSLPFKIIIRNMWNVSDVLETPLTLGYGVNRNYSYSRPTEIDPEFRVCIELCSWAPPHQEKIINPSTFGWIYISVKDEGILEEPPNFTMPEHLTNCTSIGCTATVSFTNSLYTSTEMKNVPFITILIMPVSFIILVLWKKCAKNRNSKFNVTKQEAQQFE